MEPMNGYLPVVSAPLAPPREVSYYVSVELGSLMSQLAACYDAFGYRPTGGEPPDHIAVEIGFVAYLRLKEAYAMVADDVESAAIAADAAARFRSDHLALLATPLARLVAGSGIDHLARAAERLTVYVGPPPAPTRIPLIQATDEDGGEFACCEA